ncbi:hypothetical protein DM867_05895 [Halosegnis rubeus]|uniref:YokE-like PH domain-containing protein n=1 Tax=Halosegnis rubeus TaxID=2212850 RepID=A0A5N5U8A5_9EURY|nr:hypothetical protein [Halosegnis rubeus]KAB7514649.1 hypothetical protein DM867_05895 [Halosegnis rubeus]
MYQSVNELPGRVKKRVGSLLMPDEQFVTAATTTDGLLDRWATHVVVTDQRLLLVKVIGLESTISGVRLDRLDTYRAAEGVLHLEFKYDTDSYGFDDPDTAETLVDAIEQHRADGQPEEEDPKLTLQPETQLDSLDAETADTGISPDERTE